MGVNHQPRPRPDFGSFDILTFAPRPGPNGVFGVSGRYGVVRVRQEHLRDRGYWTPGESVTASSTAFSPATRPPSTTAVSEPVKP